MEKSKEEMVMPWDETKHFETFKSAFETDREIPKESKMEKQIPETQNYFG